MSASRNKRWLKKADGKRWQRADRVAVARLFRGHVDTPSNRERGKSCRIIRRGCFWHPDQPAEAHHIDYAKPFVVAWVGLFCGCHRKVEHGTLKIPKKAIWDYTSLIEGPYGIAKPNLRRKATGPRESKAQGCICGIRGANSPVNLACPRHCVEAPNGAAGPAEVKAATPF